MSSIVDLASTSSIADMRVRTPRDLGAVIRSRRTQLRLDQKSLAMRVGVSRQWVIAVERGKPRADMTLVLRTLEALGLRLHVDEESAAGAPQPGTLAGAGTPASADAFPDIDAIVDAARRPVLAAIPAPLPPRPRKPGRSRKPTRART